jgi:hypothetical protein
MIGLGKMLKLDSFCLETEGTRFSMTANVGAASMKGEIVAISRNEVARTGQAGT